MTPALVLVDVQEDFLARPGLAPTREVLVDALATLLARARAATVPIVHVHTIVAADGGDRMPHWQRRGIAACVRGTAGALPPAALRPRAGEIVVEKRFFSGFDEASMDASLRALHVDTLVVAGLYLHGCVRSTVLAAYVHGYDVWVVDDAVGSDDPAHAELSRDYLAARAATFLDGNEIFARLADATPATASARFDAAPSSRARPPRASSPRLFRHYDPARVDEVLHEVPIADEDDVARAVAVARRVSPGLAVVAFDDRAALLERWARGLEERRDAFAAGIAREIGKPITDAQDEVDRALAHVRTAVRLFAGGDAERLADAVFVRHRPHGVVALVTPFNNPLAIPAGKIAPALVFGNAVVWKPAAEGASTTRLMLDTLAAAGAPEGAVTVVHGDARTARALVCHPDVRAVSITGSNATGRAVHALCARDGKPLQAELGGNNAAIVLEDADLEDEARVLARAAFGFAGQRCTAIRRLIVARGIFHAFAAAFGGAVAALTVGDAHDATTVVGPLVSTQRRDRVLAAMAEATASGARALQGGTVPSALAHGAWLAPIILDGVEASARVFREETFGPLAVLVAADDLAHALALANAVPHGLVAYLASRDREARRRFAAAAEAGILRVDRDAPFIHPEAPFGGFKASGIGPPEHGAWDRAFYARPQAFYGRLDGD
jgi:acyl-CoA reductase-like NAD-dependent aldehyde dehydrogenase/nicotinamidase-related amidase